VEEFLFERRAAISHFFSRVYESLSQQPYSLYFYLAFSKELIRGPSVPQGRGNQSSRGAYQGSGDSEATNLELLRRTLKQVRDDDIEVFLHYSSEVAI
jgi:hypothetical protein